MSAFIRALPHPRPLLLALTAYMCGVLCSSLLPLPIPLLLCLALVFLIASLFVPTPLPHARNLPLLLLFVCFGAARAEMVCTPLPDDINSYAGGASVWVLGTVDSAVETRPNNGFTFTLKVRAVDDYKSVIPRTGHIQVFGREIELPGYGDNLRLRGRVELPPAATNPGSFDYRAYLARRGIFTTLRIRHESDLRTDVSPIRYAIGDGVNPLINFVNRVRHALQRNNARHLSPDDAALLNGLLFGVRRSATPTDDAFSRAGTTHLLFTSGLHIALMAALVLALLRLWGIPRLRGNGLTIFLTLLYALLAGSGPAVSRSATMLILLLAAPFVRRNATPLSSLTAAAFLILLFEPLALYDAGTQISFLTVWFLLLWMPSLEKLLWQWEPGIPLRKRIGRAGLLAFVGGVVAQIGSAPLMAYYFNLFTPVSPIANLLLAPLSEILLLMGILANLLSPLPPVLIEPIWAGLHMGIQLTRTLALAFAGLPGAWISVESPPLVGIVLFYLITGGLGIVVRAYLKKPRVVLPPAQPADNIAFVPTEPEP